LFENLMRRGHIGETRGEEGIILIPDAPALIPTVPSHHLRLSKLLSFMGKYYAQTP
jgi:hypothetical protein